jgi:hypothetical protein
LVAKKFQKFDYLGCLQILHQIKSSSILCAHYDGREAFELEGSEESCLDSTALQTRWGRWKGL